MAFCVSVRGASGRDESHILLICGLRGTYRVLITFRAYVTYFRTFLIAYFDRRDLAYYLLIIGCLSYFF